MVTQQHLFVGLQRRLARGASFQRRRARFGVVETRGDDHQIGAIRIERSGTLSSAEQSSNHPGALACIGHRFTLARGATWAIVGPTVGGMRHVCTTFEPGYVFGTTTGHTSLVTTAVGTQGSAITQRVHSLNRPNMVSVGTIVWLASELMFFAGLFAMYFVARAQADGNWPPEPTHLNMKLAIPVTTILILSSFTCQMGVFAAEKGDVFGLRRWYIITLIMGTMFVIGQGVEYHALYQEGTTISSSVYGSTFFITTGFHGMHVIGGLIAFVFLIVRTRVSKFTPAQATAAIVVSYYWHFVDIVWIGLFATIYFVR